MKRKKHKPWLYLRDFVVFNTWPDCRDVLCLLGKTTTHAIIRNHAQHQFLVVSPSDTAKLCKKKLCKVLSSTNGLSVQCNPMTLSLVQSAIFSPNCYKYSLDTPDVPRCVCPKNLMCTGLAQPSISVPVYYVAQLELTKCFKSAWGFFEVTAMNQGFKV